MLLSAQVVVDAVLCICKGPGKPIDLHMVEIMEMKHKTDTDTRWAQRAMQRPLELLARGQLRVAMDTHVTISNCGVDLFCKLCLLLALATVVQHVERIGKGVIRTMSWFASPMRVLYAHLFLYLYSPYLCLPIVFTLGSVVGSIIQG